MKDLPSAAQRFFEYVQIDTQSRADSERSPSSAGQLQLAQTLAGQLRALGAAAVEVTAEGVVLATIPGVGRTVGFLAHLDTSPQAPGGPVKPLLHHYHGGVIALPYGQIDHPLLRQAMDCRIITSDGSTLLGADDKAGIAAIMTAAAQLLAEPAARHAQVRIAFTPDEELGRGTQSLDLESFGAQVAYTVDGGPLGQLEWENFYARNLRITIEGKSIHPGDAFGKLVNAVRLAGVFCSSLPAAALPETTCDRAGFIHVDGIRGDVEEAVLEVIVRDFTRQGLDSKCQAVQNLLAGIIAEPGSYRIEQTGGYLNMKEVISAQPQVLALARQAMESVGVEPKESPIRGGTDGAKLAEAGLACPNLFTGGVNFHSRTEWLVVEWLEKAAAVVAELARLWGKQ